MRNQFFYTRKEQVNGPEGETTLKEYRDSININKIIRSVEMEDGRILILMDDIHQRILEVPNINLKTNKMVGMKKETGTYQSEIYLTDPLDKETFFNLTKV